MYIALFTLQLPNLIVYNFSSNEIESIERENIFFHSTDRIERTHNFIISLHKACERIGRPRFSNKKEEEEGKEKSIIHTRLGC